MAKYNGTATPFPRECWDLRKFLERECFSEFRFWESESSTRSIVSFRRGFCFYENKIVQIFAERESKQRFSRANLNDCVSQKNKKKKKEKKKERRKKELFTQSQQIALSTLSSLPSIGDVTTTTVWDCKVTIIPYTSTNSRINNFDWTIFLFSSSSSFRTRFSYLSEKRNFSYPTF